MQDNERDEVLTEIQVNSAVTREKVEKMESTLNDVQETQSDHDDRIKKNTTKANRNRWAISAVGTGVLAALTGAVSEITKAIL